YKVTGVQTCALPILESGTGIVEYSSDGINFNGVTARSRTFTAAETGVAKDFVQYQANITGLQPATVYVYRVSVNGLEVTPRGDRSEERRVGKECRSG